MVSAWSASHTREENALLQKRSACFRALLKQWGGVCLAYRGGLENAPAYRLNHYELQAALDGGVAFLENTQVLAVEVDSKGHCAQLLCLQPWMLQGSWERVTVTHIDFCHGRWRCYGHGAWKQLVVAMVFSFTDLQAQSNPIPGFWRITAIVDGYFEVAALDGSSLSAFQDDTLQFSLSSPYCEVLLPARTVLVATGSQPNTAYTYEHRGEMERENGFYALRQLQPDGQTVVQEGVLAQSFFTTYAYKQYRVSAIGDLHPVYHGSVVKALASAQKAVAPIMQHLTMIRTSRCPQRAKADLCAQSFQAIVLAQDKLSADQVLVTVRCPWVVAKLRPGHLLKLRAFCYGDSQYQVRWAVKRSRVSRLILILLREQCRLCSLPRRMCIV